MRNRTDTGADLGYRVPVVSDACSTISQYAHDASLASLSMFAETVPAGSLLDGLAKVSLVEQGSPTSAPENRMPGRGSARRHCETRAPTSVGQGQRPR
jgi:hypothetical protein